MPLHHVNKLEGAKNLNGRARRSDCTQTGHGVRRSPSASRGSWFGLTESGERGSYLLQQSVPATTTLVRTFATSQLTTTSYSRPATGGYASLSAQRLTSSLMPVEHTPFSPGYMDSQPRCNNSFTFAFDLFNENPPWPNRDAYLRVC